MPGEINRLGSGQSPHMYKAAVGNVKIRLYIVQMTKSRCILMILNYAAARDTLVLRVLNLWVSEKLRILSSLLDLSSKMSNISLISSSVLDVARFQICFADGAKPGRRYLAANPLEDHFALPPNV